MYQVMVVLNVQLGKQYAPIAQEEKKADAERVKEVLQQK